MAESAALRAAPNSDTQGQFLAIPHGSHEVAELRSTVKAMTIEIQGAVGCPSTK